MSGGFYQGWGAFEKLLTNLNIEYSISRTERPNGNKSSVLVFCGYNSAKRFEDYIYSGVGIGIGRKKDNFLNMKKPTRTNALRP